MSTQFAKGYQTALADIQAAIENGGLKSVQEWVDNNYIKVESKPKVHRAKNVNGGSRYRGYFISKSPDEIYGIWSGNCVQPDAYVTDAYTFVQAKQIIDSYLDGGS